MSSPLIYVCDHVFDGTRQVGLIARHADGMWQFTCGLPDHPNEKPSLHAVHAQHIFENNDDLVPVALNTSEGHVSIRDKDGNWHLEVIEKDDE